MITYTVHVLGHMDERWSVWLEGWTIIHQPNGCTTLTGEVRDMAELHGLINRLFGLNLTLEALYRERETSNKSESKA